MESGYLTINGAEIYYEVQGTGTPLVMIHAGVADHRQWNNESAYFSDRYQTVRYDLRGYGKSEPVDGLYSHLGDLAALIETLKIDQPFFLMGCSMGGGLALDYTLEHSERVRGLILIGSGPGGLELDLKEPEKFSAAEEAYNKGDLDLVAEIETQIWFDGEGRTPDQVNPAMRQLAFDMNRTALGHEVKGLGQKTANTDVPAYKRLDEVTIPVLIIVGAHDLAYMHGAADFMHKELKLSRVIKIEDAAHLPNLDQPELFRRIISDYLDGLG